MQPQIFYITVDGRSRKVGELTEKGSFVKCVQASKHLFRKGNAYGIATEVVSKLVDAECKKVIIYEMDSEKKLIVDFKVFMAKGWDGQMGNFEEQRFLSLDWWDIYDVSSDIGDDMVLEQKGKKIEPVVEDKQPTLF